MNKYQKTWADYQSYKPEESMFMNLLKIGAIGFILVLLTVIYVMVS